MSGSAQAPTGQTIEFIEKGGTDKFVDVAPKAKSEFDPSAGDQFLFTAPLVDSANKRVGTLDVQCSFSKGGPAGRGICSGAFSLRGGDLLLSARLKTSGTVTGAIVGGTGVYAGARGTFKSVTAKGGDRDTITLLP